MAKIIFLHPDKRSGIGSGSGSIGQRYGSGDPDPHQNVKDPQHCYFAFQIFNILLVNLNSWDT